jgi:transmembrane sensor
LGLIVEKVNRRSYRSRAAELEELIHQHPEWQFAIQNLTDLWKHKPQPETLIQAEDAFMLHLHRMTETGVAFSDGPVDQASEAAPVRKMKWYWSAAALLVFAGGILYFSMKIRAGNHAKGLAQKEQNEISTRPGSRSRVQLPDGTVVMLNAGSKLTYNKDYGVDVRDVTLVGEGFFDVKKNKEKPFIIHTSNINIKVLGTVFNVKAYPEDKRTETSLIRGSIEVTIKNRPNDKIILSPSEKLVVENGVVLEKIAAEHTINAPAEAEIVPLVSINKLKYHEGDSSIAETQWIENRFVFNDESFDDLALRMERWYDVKIEIKDPSLQKRRMTGNFEKESISQALEALKIMIPFRYEEDGNRIIIHR